MDCRIKKKDYCSMLKKKSSMNKNHVFLKKSYCSMHKKKDYCSMLKKKYYCSNIVVV